MDLHRVTGLLARRQYGKTTIAARIALKKMMRTPGHTVVFGSVKLDLGREMVRKEAEAMQKAIGLLMRQAAAANSLLELADSEKHSALSALNADDFAELYESQRLEFRLWHDRTVYSRTKVVALTTAAVGETGDLICDEVGRVRNFREVCEAIQPIIASNPTFRCIYTTTPPPDDAHYSFELLAPPIDADLPVNPKGNWYVSELGVHVLRVTAYDAYADGIPLYDDDTGAPQDPATSRSKSHDKDAWDRNYGVKFVLGGTAAVGLIQLDAARARGVGRCTCIIVDSDGDFDRGIAWMAEHLDESPVGLGWDLATTEKATSNPSAFSVVQRQALDLVNVVTFVWKTKDPGLAKARARRIIEAVAQRKAGGRARRLCIDASNEAYFARECAVEFASLVLVESVKGGENMVRPGADPLPMKVALGNMLVGEIDDNRAVLPPERYLKEDFRRVRKDRGSFAAELGPNGEHGDTFDSNKLGLWALTSSAGAMESTDGIRMETPRFRPNRLRRFIRRLS